jgi:hypothetical protein
VAAWACWSRVDPRTTGTTNTAGIHLRQSSFGLEDHDAARGDIHSASLSFIYALAGDVVLTMTSRGRVGHRAIMPISRAPLRCSPRARVPTAAPSDRQVSSFRTSSSNDLGGFSTSWGSG